MALTITQASTRFHVARSTLYRALRDGRLSSTRADDGTKRIDVAELVRVFGEPPGGTPEQRTTDPVADELAALRREVSALSHQVEQLRALPTPQEVTVRQALRRVLARALERLAERLERQR